MGRQISSVCFANHVGQLSVLELEFPIAPRDVHKSKGVWVVNQSAKKSVDVNLRKLQQHEQITLSTPCKLRLIRL